ncbi:hypothetical protein Hypma_005071 [Hypsizygus marmoreus]|uniref:Uncharacterized protein n=1 Tax=Hypsizygus marmoreus TaxID=39966 RepID=A0A369JXE7_HYPMA|nr:hypothetical protein Hypma_005071 [Hypsizygus marmoreus]
MAFLFISGDDKKCSKCGPSFAVGSGGKKLTASLKDGGASRFKIPKSKPFPGREVGGPKRDQVYGTSVYGSGYPGITTRGVQFLGFPFVFYPVVFTAPPGVGPSYLYQTAEYGSANDTSRPGGALYQASFSTSISTFRIITDKMTLSFLSPTILNVCGSNINFNTSSLVPYNSSAFPYPRPEEAIQYYRASSVVLTLDGYNNTVALGPDPSLPPVAFPASMNNNLFSCINNTIGSSVPLVDHTPFDPNILIAVLFIAIPVAIVVIGLVICLIVDEYNRRRERARAAPQQAAPPNQYPFVQYPFCSAAPPLPVRV